MGDMATTTVRTMLDLTTKASNLTREISSGWYTASQAMTLFPIKLRELRQQSDMYSSLLIQYGMESDSFIEQPLIEVTKLLEVEEAKLQQLQDQCCLGMGRKLLFPDSVITALDGVLAAYESLSDHIDKRERLRQQLERASLNRPRLLPFLPDKKYVPLEESVSKVMRALESENSSRIVVLSGGPGQGKSSMARYIAGLYQAGIPTVGPVQRGPEQASSSLSPKTFENGVYFLRCGTEVHIKSLLVQLWEDLGFQDLPPANMKESASDRSDLQEEESILRKLSARLREQKALIVLDDVWKPTIVEKLMVQGKWVKYLVTTQVPRFRTDAIEIQISKPTKIEAEKIIANYVTGYGATMISSTLHTAIQVEVDGIVKESDSNPLVLANVAANIPDGAAFQLSEWKSARRYLADLQDGDSNRPVALYGCSYSKQTMKASMEMALNSFSSEEQTLLLLASMFESRPIPEIIFKMVFKSKYHSLAKFSKYCEHLERTNFIEIDSVRSAWYAFPRRSWSIHTMRQKFISQIKKVEMALMFATLCEQVEDNKTMAMLFVLYGQGVWYGKATRILNIPQNQLEDDNSNFSKARTVPIPLIEPFVWLLNGDPQEEWERESHQQALEVINKYIHSLNTYDRLLSELLEKPHMFSAACEALHVVHMLYSTSNKFEIQEVPISVLDTLVQNLDITKAPALQRHAVLTLIIISQNVRKNAIDIASHPHAIERLVALLDYQMDVAVCKDATFALGKISEDIVDNAVKVGLTENALEGLAALLKDGNSIEVQSCAGWALGEICKDVKENAVKVASFPTFPNVVARIVALLNEQMPPEVQKDAAFALGCLSKHMVEVATRVGKTNAIEKLVALLAPGVDLEAQKHAIWALRQISENVVENAMKVGLFPNAVERLVTLLEKGIDCEVQKYAVWTLGEVSKNVVANADKIGSYEHTVERLVALLEDPRNPESQGLAAWVLGQLSKNVVQNATSIGSFPHAVERLVALLDDQMNPASQGNAAIALGQLSTSVIENAIKIVSFPNAIERLVGLLEETLDPEIPWKAAFALGQLSKSVLQNAIKIGSLPNTVKRLAALLEEGKSPQDQQMAIFALGELSKSAANAIKIGLCPHAVESIVGLMEVGKSSQLQQSAACVLMCISEHMKIESSHLVVEQLVGLLAKDGDLNVQKAILVCLYCLSCGLSENQSLLKRAFRKNPNSLEVLACWACCQRQGNGSLQYWGAKVYYLASEGKERKYESSSAYRGEGDVKVSQGDYRGALRAFESGLAIEKEDMVLVSQRSFVKAKLGNDYLKGALDDANEFLQKGNNRSYGLQERGILKRLMGDLPGALADLEEGLELSSDDYESLKHRGLVKFLLKDEDGARADAEWALRVKPPQVDGDSYGRGACLGESSVEFLGFKLK